MKLAAKIALAALLPIAACGTGLPAYAGDPAVSGSDFSATPDPDVPALEVYRDNSKVVVVDAGGKLCGPLKILAADGRALFEVEAGKCWPVN